jgi:asparagine synthase (glutamine-hydrolysing)
LNRSALASWARDFAGLRSSFASFQEARSLPAGRLNFPERNPDFMIALRDAGGLWGQQMLDNLGQPDADPLALFTIPAPRPAIPISITRLICQTYLAENGIAQGDRLSMASSVELRLPLVDYRLVETVIGLRKCADDSSLPQKAWFKAALKDTVPPEVMARPKRGFAPPTHVWHKALFDRYGDSLADGYLVDSGYLGIAAGRALAAGPFPAGAFTPLSFKALVLEQWCRQMSPAAAKAGRQQPGSRAEAVHSVLSAQ